MPPKLTRILLAAAGAAVLLAAASLGGRHWLRTRQLAPFNEHAAKYAELPRPKGPATPAGHRGKIVPVDVSRKEADWVYFELPEDLRAAGPEEVKTVAQLEWQELQVGFYGDGNKKAYRVVCRLRLVDRETGTLVAEETFEGGDPPAAIKKRQFSGVGSRPTDKLVEFLRGRAGA